MAHSEAVGARAAASIDVGVRHQMCKTNQRHFGTIFAGLAAGKLIAVRRMARGLDALTCGVVLLGACS